MTSPLLRLSANQLQDLATALRNGTITLGSQPFMLTSRVPAKAADAVAADFAERRAIGMHPDHVADLLTLLAEQRRTVEAEIGRHDLVWTGPQAKGSASRDTQVVVRELFRSAESHVVLSTYSIYRGAEFFEPLAERMAERPGLTVHLFANVERKAGKTAQEAIDKFATDFGNYHWPWNRRPQVFFDPRAQDEAAGAVLHAKCIVVDERRALITSANFTEAASERNIEAGVLTTDKALVQALSSQFRRLVAEKVLVRLPGW